MPRGSRPTAAGVLAATLTLVLAACAGGGSTGSGPSTPTTNPPPAGGTRGPNSPNSATASGPGTGAPAAFPFQPLYPFTDVSAVGAWQAAYRRDGHQPWHLDPGATARSFTAHLGLTGVDQVLDVTVTGGEARVRLGYRNPDAGRLAAAAVVHLARFGAGPDAPWEVVGTDDTTFSVTRPIYGTVVDSPITVAGRISGVDESVTVTVFETSTSRPLGTSCCLEAGGDDAP